jgi:hypothetical protein
LKDIEKHETTARDINLRPDYHSELLNFIDQKLKGMK